MTSSTTLIIAGLVMLLLVAAACGPASVEQPVPAGTTSTRPETAPIPESITEYVIFNDALSDPQAIADWYNSLPGSSYRGRVIKRLISMTAYHIYGKMNRDVFAYVELKPLH